MFHLSLFPDLEDGEAEGEGYDHLDFRRPVNELKPQYLSTESIKTERSRNTSGRSRQEGNIYCGNVVISNIFQKQQEQPRVEQEQRAGGDLHHGAGRAQPQPLQQPRPGLDRLRAQQLREAQPERGHAQDQEDDIPARQL